MTQPRVRKTKWDGTLREAMPPPMEELLKRIERLEHRRAAEPTAVASH